MCPSLNKVVIIIETFAEINLMYSWMEHNAQHSILIVQHEGQPILTVRSHLKVLRGEELNYKTRWAPDNMVAMDDF